MKKSITLTTAILLILALCLSLCACTPSPSPEEDFEYEFDNGEVTITGYKGDDLDIVIPETIKGRPVTAIGEEAFAESDITSIFLPDTVTSIDDYAFVVCRELEEIDFGESLETIGDEAFFGCDSLTTVHIPETVTDMERSCFGISEDENDSSDDYTFECTIYGESGSAAEDYVDEVSEEYETSDITFEEE